MGTWHRSPIEAGGCRIDARMMRARLPCHEFFCSGALALKVTSLTMTGPGPGLPAVRTGAHGVGKLDWPASSTESDTTAAVESVDSGDGVDAMAVVAAPSLSAASAPLKRELLVGVGALLAVAATFALAPIGGSLRAMRLESVGRLLVAGIPMAVGLYAWRGVPFGRLGILLVLSGGVWLVVTFSLADQALAYSIGRVADWIGWAAIIYLFLAFPEGRLADRVDRTLAASFGLVVLVLWLPTALLVNRYPTPSDWVTCAANCPHNAFMIVSHEPGVVASVVLPLRELLVVLLFLAVVARLFHASSRPARFAEGR